MYMIFVAGLIMKNTQKISMILFERENKMLFIRDINMIMVNEGRKSYVLLKLYFQQISFISAMNIYMIFRVF